jgi:glycosyltransferase involved in cell wall biosynthesis
MRVLHIAAGNLYGGVETLLVTLARFRDLCSSMEPEFAVCFEGRLSEELEAAGVSVHRLGAVRTRQPLSVWRGRTRLSELLRQRQFDAVVCHSAWPQAIFGPVIRGARIALIAWRHDSGDGRHWLERWARLTSADLTICNSHFTRKSAEALLSGLRSEVISYPVAPHPAILSDVDRAALREQLGAGQQTTVIVQVSRMEAWKGHSLHLRALSKLRDRKDWVCWIVGGAQRPHELRYLEELRVMAANLGIDDRVIFLGQRNDVQRLLAAADIFCQPNTGSEPFGIVFIEALYAGLPVVTTAIGGGGEIVDDSCGVLVPQNDENTLADTLDDLIRNPESRARLASRGRRRAANLCDPARQLTTLADAIVATAQSRMRATHGVPGSWTKESRQSQ